MAERLAIRLPSSLVAEREGAVAILRLNRPHKRNALDDEMIIGIMRVRRRRWLWQTSGSIPETP
jgi:hypothetical protein